MKFRVLSEEEKTAALVYGSNQSSVTVPAKAINKGASGVRQLEWEYLTEGWEEQDRKQIGDLRKQARLDLENTQGERKPTSIRMRCKFEGEGALTFLMHSNTNSGMKVYLNIGELDKDCSREEYAISHFGMENDRTYSTTVNVPPTGEHFIEFCYSGVLTKEEVNELIATTEISLAPASGNTEYDVVRIDNQAFVYHDQLEELILENGIQEMGDEVCHYCMNLKKVSLPGSLESIGVSAFRECVSLEEINLPEGLKSMGMITFNNCTSLKEITIPSTLKIIPQYAFSGCRNLLTVHLAGQIDEVWGGAFLSCEKLTEVIIPREVRSIEGWAYKNCQSVRSLLIPTSVTNIGGLAFDCCYSLESLYYSPEACEQTGSEKFPMIDRCPKLKTLVIGAEVKSIPPYTFNNCTNLETIIVLTPEPPEGLASLFDDVDKQKCTLQVPEGYKDRFADSDVWKGFMQVEEIDPAGIPVAKTDDGAKLMKVYNMEGVLVLSTTSRAEILNLPAGVYIIDGKKQIIK